MIGETVCNLIMVGHVEAINYGYSFTKVASKAAVDFQKNLARTIAVSLSAVVCAALGDKKALDELMG